jgi:hypothetical protein
MGFEPMTCCLRNSCSTPELHWLFRGKCEGGRYRRKTLGGKRLFTGLAWNRDFFPEEVDLARIWENQAGQGGGGPISIPGAMNCARIFSLAVLLVLALGVAGPREALGQETAKPVPAFTDGEAAKHVGEEVAITGKVVAVAKTGKGTTYLNFGDRFPKHTFSGTVRAEDEAKVGDVKQYEGKVVTITGRVELAKDGKPQIFVIAPGQIRGK